MAAKQGEDVSAHRRFLRTRHTDIDRDHGRFLLSRCLLSLLFTAVMISPLRAQNFSSLTGRVVDSANLPIVGAQGTGIRSKGRVERTAVSNRGGEFSVQLEPGDYTIKFTKTAFGAVVRTVQVGPTASNLHDIVLAIAPLQNTVQVTDESNYLTTETSSATRTLTPLLDVPQTVNSV